MAPPFLLPGISSDTPEHEKAHKWNGAEWGSTEKICSVCGVTQIDLVRVDMEDPSGTAAGVKVKMFHYRDAQNKTISSMIPLSCPTFVGDVNGAVGETKQRLRVVTGRVGSVEGRVDGVEDRMARLEEDNRAMRERMDQDREKVMAFVQWLAEMVKEHSRQGLPAVEMLVEEERYLLPEPVANVIKSMGAIPTKVVDVEAEYVTVPAKPRE